jgi:hypothetical protein
MVEDGPIGVHLPRFSAQATRDHVFGHLRAKTGFVADGAKLASDERFLGPCLSLRKTGLGIVQAALKRIDLRF